MPQTLLQVLVPGATAQGQPLPPRVRPAASRRQIRSRTTHERIWRCPHQAGYVQHPHDRAWSVHQTRRRRRPAPQDLARALPRQPALPRRVPHSPALYFPRLSRAQAHTHRRSRPLRRHHRSHRRWSGCVHLVDDCRRGSWPFVDRRPLRAWARAAPRRPQTSLYRQVIAYACPRCVMRRRASLKGCCRRVHRQGCSGKRDTAGVAVGVHGCVRQVTYIGSSLRSHPPSSTPQ